MITQVKYLTDQHFTIAMDDFRTGYSSLERLSFLTFDTIKIDRSLLLAASNGNKAARKHFKKAVSLSLRC